MIKPGTTFAEEVVTGLAYLEITTVDSVEYSGLMIDAERIVGMQVRVRATFRGELDGIDLELQTDEAGNLMALDLLIM